MQKHRMVLFSYLMKINPDLSLKQELFCKIFQEGECGKLLYDIAKEFQIDNLYSSDYQEASSCIQLLISTLKLHLHLMCETRIPSVLVKEKRYFAALCEVRFIVAVLIDVFCLCFLRNDLGFFITKVLKKIVYSAVLREFYLDKPLPYQIVSVHEAKPYRSLKTLVMCSINRNADIHKKFLKREDITSAGTLFKEALDFCSKLRHNLLKAIDAHPLLYFEVESS